jgi:hypothetical protein
MRLSLGLGLIGFVGTGLYSSYTAWLAHWEAEEHRASRLDKHLRAACKGVTERVQVCRDLVAGRLTLLEAAAWFGAIDAAMPPKWRLPCVAYPDHSEGERQCRRVIEYMDALYDEEAEPGPLQAVRARLTAELQKHLDAMETITLPNVKPGGSGPVL